MTKLYKEITSFSGENRFLSNFWPCIIEFDGLYFSSTEAAYVASKTLDRSLREKISTIVSAGEVKKFGRKLELRPDWDQVKDGFMLQFVEQKFTDKVLMKRLYDTCDAMLIEGNTWGDTYWGVCKGVGKNVLGNILMNVRSRIIERQGHLFLMQKAPNDLWCVGCSPENCGGCGIAV